jgi:hypothetical protein
MCYYSFPSPPSVMFNAIYNHMAWIHGVLPWRQKMKHETRHQLPISTEVMNAQGLFLTPVLFHVVLMGG